MHLCSPQPPPPLPLPYFFSLLARAVKFEFFFLEQILANVLSATGSAELPQNVGKRPTGHVASSSDDARQFNRLRCGGQTKKLRLRAELSIRKRLCMRLRRQRRRQGRRRQRGIWRRSKGRSTAAAAAAADGRWLPLIAKPPTRPA